MALSMVLSPLLSVVFRLAADSLITKICHIHGLDNYRRKLHRQLLAIQEMIADAEERRVESQAVQEWMKDLGAAANEALDVLGEFQYEALRQNAISQQSCASAKVIKDFFTHENHLVFHYKMRNKLTKVLGQIDEIVTEMNKFNFIRRDPTPTIDRETHSFVVESEIIGRDSDKEKVVSKLMDPKQVRDNVSVLAIVGMGGLGKTTLAQMVYNDDRIKKHFQLFMWVCVSTEFRVTNISKSILEVATNENDISISNKEVLQSRLQGILGRKKYLLVLDDVWNEEKEKWDELRTLLFSGAGSGSIIMVTTRSKEVAKIMGTLPSHDLEPLNDEDSWMLFQKRAFDVTVEEPSEELYAIGRTIVRKCVGLPLVVKAMGGLMRTKREMHDWRAISENNVLNGLRNSKRNINSIMDG
ncbi:Disease resistance protein (CC-NBS-LRR class) family [Rhynchospora pubera]|uniref:Disease resistance protein (CC-NBS-LRR class) family n=1 Tax=Rhynchospora pubera TaxID=906938 RepID=A0AAV8DCL1_9POAL|nr:Disease resistance protein (CC-NBS-LRR class) family [Rhynchospora pubera]